MARSLDIFSRRMNVLANRLVSGADRLTRKVALVADQVIVSETPVDTGRAKSNWIVNLDAPASDTIEAYAPGEQGTTEGQNIQAALDQGSTVIANYRTGSEIHITNNLSYIQPLNDGSSDQAPANFVETAIQEAVNAVQSSHILDG